MRNRTLFIVLGLLVLLGGFLLLKSQYLSFKTLTKEGLTISNRLKALETRRLDLEKLSKNFKTIKDKEEVKKAALLIPEKPSLSPLTANLEAFASAHGLLLSSLTFREPPKQATEELNTIELTADFMGKLDYPMLRIFIKNLENHLRLLEITSFHFNPTQPSISLNLKTFSLSELSNLPPETPLSAGFSTDLFQNPKFKDLKVFGALPTSFEKISNPNPFFLPPPSPLR
jgi:Tfp pilus assembly protein PilO